MSLPDDHDDHDDHDDRIIISPRELTEEERIREYVYGKKKKEVIQNAQNVININVGQMAPYNPYSPEDIKRRQEEKEKIEEDKDNISEEELDKLIEKQQKILKEKYEESINITIRPKLSEDNFVMKYIRYAETITDAYPEWHFAAATSLLSIAADRKLTMKLSIGVIYTNLWYICLGDSTYARKTTGMDIAKDFPSMMGIQYKQLPDSFSPESFIEEMSQDSKRFFWLDEAGQFLKTLKKAYMEEIVDMFCRLYGCGDFSRKLRTSQRKNILTEFHVKDCYITQWLLTTPENFKANTDVLDITSGWLVRYLYIHPEYPKEWMGFRKKSEKDSKLYEEVVSTFKSRMDFISKINIDFINMDFSPEAWEFFETWLKMREEIAVRDNDKIAKAILGRLQIYAIKLAMLFQFGEPIFKAIICKEMIQESCRLIDEYFLPIAKKIIVDVGVDQLKNLIEKIIALIRRSGGSITRRDLLRSLHKQLRDIDNALESLIASGEIKELKSGRKHIYMLTGE